MKTIIVMAVGFLVLGVGLSRGDISVDPSGNVIDTLSDQQVQQNIDNLKEQIIRITGAEASAQSTLQTLAARKLVLQAQLDALVLAQEESKHIKDPAPIEPGQ